MTPTYAFDAVVELLSAVLTRHGYSQAIAKLLATNCASAERDGSVSHGIFRIRHYLSTLRSGYVDGHAVPVVHDASPGLLRVNAANGFAQVAIDAAREQLVHKARHNGIAALAIRNSHHLGALYLDVEPFAEMGLVALAVVNSAPSVAPPGAHRAVYGTNPIAFAAPRASAAPVVFDQASSTMAYGDVQVAHQQGHELPPHSGIDKYGATTADPAAILDGGALLTFGGYKGASIALMVELLCAAFVGASFSHEVDWSANPGAMTARTGETLIVIDSTQGAEGLAPMAGRVDELIQALKAAGQGYIPGDKRLQNRVAHQGRVPIGAADWQALQKLLSDA